MKNLNYFIFAFLLLILSTAHKGFSQCDPIPPENFQWAIKKKWSSEEGTPNPAASYSNVYAADLDNDGIVEIVTSNRIVSGNEGYLSVISGATGKTLAQKKLPGINPTSTLYSIALADTDKDGLVDIFIAHFSNDKRIISHYEYQNNTITYLGSMGPVYPSVSVTLGEIGITDFNLDGTPELYIGDEIYNPILHTKILDLNLGIDKVSYGTLAADILPGNPGLEFVTGGRVYTMNGVLLADINNIVFPFYHPNSQVLINNYNATYNYAYVSTADFTGDGRLDLVLTGFYNEGGPKVGVFFWDVNNATVNKVTLPNTWQNGTGRVNIANLDDDPALEFSLSSGKNDISGTNNDKTDKGYLYVIDDDFSLKWIKQTFEGSSGVTGTTVFDFDRDGKAEIIYRDQKYLYILDGETGNAILTTLCYSRTLTEYPIIVDVDNDGEAEIVVSCLKGYETPADDPNESVYKNLVGDGWWGYLNAQGEVRVYETDGSQWPAVRNIWNQHDYKVYNILDNGQVPITQPNFSLPQYQVLNRYLNQTRPLKKGLPEDPLKPDLAIQDNVEIINPTCPNTSFNIKFTVENVGGIELDKLKIPVSVYSGNPEIAADYLGTFTITLPIGFPPGAIETFTSPNINAKNFAEDIYVVLNYNDPIDPVNNIPINMDHIKGNPPGFNDSGFIDCDNSNNIASGTLQPNGFTLELDIDDNESCNNNNATGKAQVINLNPIGDYEFTLFDDNGGNIGPINTGPQPSPVFNNLSGGDYWITAYNTKKGCSADTIPFSINNTGLEAPTFTVEVTQNNSLCSGSADAIPNPTKADVFKGNGIITVTEVNGVPVDLNNPPPYYVYLYNNGIPDMDINFGTPIQVGYQITGLIETASPYIIVISPIDINMVSPDCALNQEAVSIEDDTSTPTPNVQANNIDQCGILGSIDVDIPTAVMPYSDYLVRLYKTNSNNLIDEQAYAGGILTFSNLDVDNYWVQVLDTARDCQSALVPVSISDVTTPPILALDFVSDNTSCDLSNPNGQIGVMETNGAPGPLVYQWFKGNSVVITPQNQPIPGYTTNTTPAELAPGTYSVKVTSAEGCSASLVGITVGDASMPLADPMGGSTPVTDCNPVNGTLSVVDNGFTYLWYIDTPPDMNNFDPLVFDFTGPNVVNVDIGDYYVVAYDPVSGCVSNPVLVVVGDAKPTVVFNEGATPVPNNCLDPNIQLYVDPTINGMANQIPAANTFSFTWYEGDPNDNIVIATNLDPNGLMTNPGLVQPGKAYTAVLVLADPNIYGGGAGCIYEKEVVVPNVPTAPSAIAMSTDLTSCLAPNGTAEATITNLMMGDDQDLDYTYEWFLGKVDQTPDYTGRTPSGMVAGTYTLVVTHIATNCINTFQDIITIDDLTETPEITNANITNNTICDNGVTPFDGVIEITDIGFGNLVQVNNPNFEYTWYVNNLNPGNLIYQDTGNNGGNLLNSMKASQDIGPGTYYVVVYNLNSDCSDTTNYNIADISAQPLITMQGSTDATGCDNVALGGVYTISEIQENGMVQPLGNYTYDWFDSQNNPIIDPVPGTINVLEQLTAGNYFVLITNQNTGCTNQHDFVIGQNYTPPSLSAQNMSPNVSCDIMNANGSVDITDGLGNTSSLEWLDANNANNDIAGTLMPDAFNPTNVPPSTYLIIATDPVSLCTDTIQVIIPDDSSDPIVSTPSTLPVTTCEIPANGAANINIAGDPAMHTFTWYQFDGANFVDMGIGGLGVNSQNTLDIGTYQVTVEDMNSCITTVEFNINDSRVYPQVSIQELNPDTDCDDVTGNGVLEAIIENPVKGETYDYSWTDSNNNIVGDNNPILTDALAGETYSVVVLTSKGCSTLSPASFTVTNDPTVVATPTIEVIKNHVSCDSEDGQLQASVDGNIVGYDFYWFNSAPTEPVNINAADHIGFSYPNLTSGVYYVVAVDEDTKCVSPIASDSIKDSRITPAFEIFVQDATCNEDDGFAYVIPIKGEIKEVKWVSEYDEYIGPILSGVPAGSYTVTVTSNGNCAADSSFTIIEDIIVYNGISPGNVDGANDTWFIDCIKHYPDNHIEIYNREGKLVYEADGYNNEDIVFTGVGNVGVYVAGNRLPSGTYFFVVRINNSDKKPISGFLELK